MIYAKTDYLPINGRSVILFGETIVDYQPFFLALANGYCRIMFLRQSEIVDKNDNQLTLEQIYAAINNADLTGIIKTLKSESLSAFILENPKITETHKRLIKMYSNQ